METVTDVAADAPASPPVEPAEHLRRPTPRWLPAALPILLFVVAALLRFADLGHPPRTYFDEVYYANDAVQLLERGVEEGFVVHPQVGKWLIAAGIATFYDLPEDGYPATEDDEGEHIAVDPLFSRSWRVAPALAGSLLVLVVYFAARRLFASRGPAALAGLLVAVDGLAFTMSRIAMLDIFLALFVAAGFWCLLIDRDQQWAGVEAFDARVDGEAGALPRRPHMFRWLAGVAFGLGLATKWSALLAVAAAGLFVLISELAWRRRITGRWLVHPERIVASGLATLVLVPALVYVVSYASWFANFERTEQATADGGLCFEQDCPQNLSVGVIFGEWVKEQRDIEGFHRNLTADHPYRASALTFPILERPVAYYFESCDDPASPPEGGCVVGQGNVEEILGLGNPAIWWMGLGAYLVVLGFAVLRRDWRAWTVLGFLALQYVPWIATARPAFLFYMTPAVPFVCLALAYVGWQGLAHRAWRWLPGLIAVLAVAGFLFWHPIFVGAEITRPAWDLRIWPNSWI